MQALLSQSYSRTSRWVVLLLVLVGIYIYIQLSPPAQKTEPYDRTELDKLEQILEQNFKPRIDRIGPIDQVEVIGKRASVVNPQHHSSPVFSDSIRTTQGYDERNIVLSKTTKPGYLIYGRLRWTTTVDTPFVQLSGYVKSSVGGGNLNLSSSGLTIDDIPDYYVREVSCAKLIDGDMVEMNKAEEYQRTNLKVPIPDNAYLQMTQDCVKFKMSRRYFAKPASDEEAGFPIAYSIMMFKDVEQVERLLRAIYRPQNYYCIHVDKKSSLDIHRTMESIANCFDNVFIPSRAVDVQWGWYSVLEPDIMCMEELYNRYKKWKYFINLTGQEFPLKTNLDIVRILRVYNGSNNMEGTEQRRNTERTEYVHNGFFPTEMLKGPPPAGIVLTKGSVHITVSRAFVGFMLKNPVAKKFREWVKDSGVPDETFFSSLNHSPLLGVPGAYKGNPETEPYTNPLITRFKNWGTWPFDYPCAGQRIRMVCVFGVGDLPLLSRRPELFTNKFYLDYQPLALDCMEELHYNRTRQELQGLLSFDTRYYRGLDFVKKHN